MSSRTSPINVTILDKRYLIACEDHEIEQLQSAVEYINRKMCELKEEGSLIGGERIAVMAALNVASEMLAYKSEKEGYSSRIVGMVQRLQNKIDQALTPAN